MKAPKYRFPLSFGCQREFSSFPSVCEDPPRPPDDSPLQLEMSGYMAARGDFTLEYDNFAEHDIRDMDFDTLRYDEDEVEKGKLSETFCFRII